jgi:hypothetical protein
MTAEELRDRLRSSEVGFLDKYTNRLSFVEGWRPWFAGGAVIGAMIAAVGRAIDSQKHPELTIVMSVSGAMTAAIFGLLVVLMDFKKLEIGNEAKNSLKVAEDSINLSSELEKKLKIESEGFKSHLEDCRQFDLKRLDRIEAIRLMVEVAEAALLTNASVEKSAEHLLSMAGSKIRASCDYKTDDFHTITIFQMIAGAPDKMVPIARSWTDPSKADGGRSWEKGFGYTGLLWSWAVDNSKAQIVEPDTATPEARARYRVGEPDAEREARYRSVACFPILVGRENKVWGVVTATSSRAGVFKHEGGLARQSVECVRDVAMVAGLLAKLNHAQHG